MAYPYHDLTKYHTHPGSTDVGPSTPNDKEDEEEMDSSADSYDMTYGGLTLPVLNLIGPFSQTIALWSYTKHNCLTMFMPGSPDLMSQVVDYATDNLSYDRQKHTIKMLTPGELSPFDIMNVYSIRPGSVLLITPKERSIITITISQFNTSFTLATDLTETVQKLKSQVKKIRGIPTERQEILYNEQALENDHRLLEYKIRHGSKLYVMIQTHFDLLINVETFWGITYRFYLDPCSTGKEIVNMVLRRTFSKHGTEEEKIFDSYIPFHNLILMYKSKFIHWDYCLAYYEIKSGEKLKLTTVGHQSKIKMQEVTIVTETGEQYLMSLSRYDRWSVVAFMLHGLTNVPIDFMRLFKNKVVLHMLSMVGDVPEYTRIFMSTVMTYLDKGTMFGVPIRVYAGNGIIENLKIAPNRKVKSIKKNLERMGIPNATIHELTIRNKKLHNSSQVQSVISDIDYPLSLKLEKFHVFVHTSEGLIYKTHIDTMLTIGEFKEKMSQKSEHDMSRCRLLIGGDDLPTEDKTVLYDSGVSVGTSIFLKLYHDFDVFFILGTDWTAKVKVPVHPWGSDIRSVVRDNRAIPTGCINCILTFLYWFFLPRMIKLQNPTVRKRMMTRIPHAKQEMAFLEQMRQDLVPIRVPGEYLPALNMSLPNLYHPKRPGVNISFEPSQFLDIAKRRTKDNDAQSSEIGMVPHARTRTLQWIKRLQY